MTKVKLRFAIDCYMPAHAKAQKPTHTYRKSRNASPAFVVMIGLAKARRNFLPFLRISNLELLLQENRCLLVVVADDLVNDVLPVAVDIAIKQAAVVERLGSR